MLFYGLLAQAKSEIAGISKDNTPLLENPKRRAVERESSTALAPRTLPPSRGGRLVHSTRKLRALTYVDSAQPQALAHGVLFCNSVELHFQCLH